MSSQGSIRPRIKVWLEKGDRLVLSDYRVRMLEIIAEKGSLAEAAAEMGLSYRRAWGKIREIEDNLGMKLVHSTVGGPGGGNTRLTAEAERLVAQYARFRKALGEDAEADFAQSFSEG
jgi:molybdate transport system regulatory protein